jgi:hypothetical protein
LASERECLSRKPLSSWTSERVDRIRLAILLSILFQLISALFFLSIFAGAASVLLPYLNGSASFELQDFTGRVVFGSAVTTAGLAGFAIFLALGGALYLYALRSSILEVLGSGHEIGYMAFWVATMLLFEAAGLAAYHFFGRRRTTS